MANETTVIAEPNSPIIRYERVFDAPRQKVFDMFTKAEYVEKWWNPRATARVDALELREGGLWKFSHEDPEAGTVSFHGYFHEVSAPVRFIQTVEFDNLEAMIGERGHTVLGRYDFTELPDGRTQYIGVEVYLSVEDRDQAVASGMNTGVTACFEAIDRLIQAAA
jgi:uncharacterized protein YndB with AHSA1/START domain